MNIIVSQNPTLDISVKFPFHSFPKHPKSIYIHKQKSLSSTVINRSCSDIALDAGAPGNDTSAINE